MKVYIGTPLDPVDMGQGGIKRVIEAQHQYLPQYGWEIAASEAEADVVAVHAGDYVHTLKPLVAHTHGLYWQEYEWQEWAHRLNDQVINVLRRCDLATAPSDWVTHILRRGMNIPALTVQHGIDAEKWTPRDKIHGYVLWNKTRVDPICDVVPLNEMARRLPEVRFVSTYGTPASNVVITGRLPHEHAQRQIENASVYLCTARETFGIGTLEAMASGAVVVGFDWGGQSDIIAHTEDGVLVTPYDYDALEAGIRYALEPDNHARMAAAALHKVRTQYTWEQAVAAYAEVYERALGQQPHKELPRTSVIITCYNLADVLPRAVNSVLSQTDKDVEVVVVDDASPDATAAVAARLADEDSRVRVVTNQSNLYLAGSLDAGIGASSGRYIVPLDADNELAAGALQTLADALDKNPDIDIAYGSMLVQQEWPGGLTFVSGWPQQFDYTQQMAHRNQLPSTSMYRRKWWERSGGYRRRCRTAEDADFWCRVTSLGAQPRKVTDAPTLVYHERKESMSHVEADWDWTAWYTWSRLPSLTPFGAPSSGRKHVPTYEPALVTVVIPVGPGHGKYLADALDSLVAQTYQNWRCIVVDDRPAGQKERLAVPPWARWLSTTGRGPAYARNAGIRNVDTPWTLLLDADDYLAPGALEILVSTALDRKASEYYYCDWYKQEEGKVYTAPDFDARHLVTHLTHSVTALYPTHALQAVGGFDETLDAWEDWDLVLKLIEHGLCGVHVPFPLFYYRYHAGTRREQLYKDRERHTAVMQAKWHKYMVEKQPMPCGCQGGRTMFKAPVVVDGQAVPTSRDGRTQVEFVGTSAPRTYRGANREYRFGSDRGHNVHWVDNVDLPIFLGRAGFQLAVVPNVDTPLLDAKGPPNREAEFAEPPAYEMEVAQTH